MSDSLIADWIIPYKIWVQAGFSTNLFSILGSTFLISSVTDQIQLFFFQNDHFQNFIFKFLNNFYLLLISHQQTKLTDKPVHT